MKLWEGPIESNCFPVCGPSSDTVLASDRTRVPGGFELGNFKKEVARGNHTGISEPETQKVLGKVETIVKVGPLQSWESRSGGGEKKCKLPKIRKKCAWKHTRKKRWVECPLRKKLLYFSLRCETGGGAYVEMRPRVIGAYELCIPDFGRLANCTPVSWFHNHLKKIGQCSSLETAPPGRQEFWPRSQERASAARSCKYRGAERQVWGRQAKA